MGFAQCLHQLYISSFIHGNRGTPARACSLLLFYEGICSLSLRKKNYVDVEICSCVNSLHELRKKGRLGPTHCMSPILNPIPSTSKIETKEVNGHQEGAWLLLNHWGKRSEHLIHAKKPQALEKKQLRSIFCVGPSPGPCSDGSGGIPRDLPTDRRDAWERSLLKLLAA